MSAKIIISVPRDPSKGVTVDVDGLTGSTCTKLTQRLEEALGHVKERETKPEYEMRAAEQQDELTQ